MFKRGVVFILIVWIALPAFCQVQVNGRFYADSLKIGEPVPYSLTARYPKSFNLVFPDSTYTFAPFEFERKEFFPTRSNAETSFDSVVYYVSSYEIDSVQQLQLPVFVIHANDCTTVMAETDQIFLKHLVESVPDSLAAPQLPLKTQTSYLNVKWLLNYPLLLIIGGVLVALLIVAWFIFGKRISQHFRAKKLARKHQQFIELFDGAVRHLTESFTGKNAEKALVIWKQYMEDLESRPYTKYTTLEIKRAFANNELSSSLSTIDQMVYGHILLKSVDSFNQLKSEAEKSFRQKTIELGLRTKKVSQYQAGDSSSSQQLPSQVPRQATQADIVNYAYILQGLPCPHCQRTDKKLNGAILHTVKSFIVLTFHQKKPVIGCSSCLQKKINLAMASTALFGWWGVPWGLIKTPQYIYLNIQQKKKAKVDGPNEVLLSFALHHANDIAAQIDDKEKLQEIIRNKKSWWQF